LAFSTAGASKIVLLGRTEASLKETASYLPSGISSSVHAIDIAEEEALQDVAATVGKWDILILAAGHISTPDPIVEASSNGWWQSFEV